MHGVFVFRIGMRADWILTDEERVNKRRKIEENRRLRRLIYPDTADSDEVRNFSNDFRNISRLFVLSNSLQVL